jgi:transglutaminase-like putative cysteine protease
MKTMSTRSWDPQAAAILYVFLLLSTLRLIATNWTSGLNTALWLTLFGVPLGLALGVSRFRPIHASLLALGYSLVLLPWTLGNVLFKDIPWLERMANLLGRVGISLDLFSQKKPVEDTLLFILLIALVYWVISLAAGYQWSRNENAVAALLPAWVTLVMIQVYDNLRFNRIIFLVFCMFFSLLLLGRRFMIFKRRSWKEKKIRFSVESGKEMNLLLVISSSAVILLAWVIPVPARPLLFAESIWEQVSQPWQSARKYLGNAVAGLESHSSSSSYDYYNSNLLQLGQRAITGNAAIFNVSIPSNPVSNRYYWRVRSFDLYSNSQWQSSTTNSRFQVPDMPNLVLPGSSQANLTEFSFTISQGRIFNLVTPAKTVWISRPAEVSLFRAGVGVVDPILLRADNAVHAGETYRTLAMESNPTLVELRQAGEEYPAWVVDHYLQLPGNLPTRVRNLAAQIIAGRETPYDKAAAITAYLRSEITYKKVVSRPPFGADMLEWFLLDYKQGYCNYYATAEVILLRTLGIPARLVVGFTQGERLDNQEEILVVKQKDAHAWPEVFFPGIGWVEFEPTSSQPTIIRPRGLDPLFIGNSTPAANTLLELDGQEATLQPLDRTPIPQEETPAPVIVEETTVPAFVYVLFGFIIITLSGMLIWRSQQLKRSIPTPLPVRLRNSLERNSIHVPGWLIQWADLVSQAPIERAYRVIPQSLRRLGQVPRPSDTPLETTSILMELLPAAGREILCLREEYQKYMFSREPVNSGIAIQSSISIRKQTSQRVVHTWLEKIKAGLKHRFIRRAGGVEFQDQ